MIDRLLLLAQAPLALAVLYLDLLSAAAQWPRRAPAPGLPQTRFAILIPAHDEEVLLPRLLASLTTLDYPRDRYTVHVVADNCRDDTAALAAAAGATVHERHDETLRGKGYALRWLLERLAPAEAPYDAYVIVDADSVVSPNFLSVMNAHLQRGDRAIQSYYGVLNAGESWQSGLRYIAFALFNGLRPCGRDALGLSVGLHGNGMCFAAAVLIDEGWDAYTLAEDAEFHMRLVARGITVTYAGEATILAEMPVSLKEAHSQNMRWERGRLHLLRRYGLPFLWSGLWRRDPARLDAVAEQLIPPFSVLTALSVLGVAATVALRTPAARRLSVGIALGQGAYIIAGLRLVRAPVRIYTTLLLAPLYLVWKLRLYLQALVSGRGGAWIRTARRSR